MCKTALISWPIDSISPNNFYINLGEMYDKDFNKDVTLLSQFNRELRYLYPFTYSVENKKCYNSEDFKTFKSKYRLTVGYRLVGKIQSKEIIIFRTPILYDLTCMVPLFNKICYEKIIYNPAHSRTIYIVVPTNDPICRGKILDEVISGNPKYIILTGSVSGDNNISTITLMTRYLRRRGVPGDIIIRCNSDKRPTCILDCLEIINIMNLNELDIAVACSCSDITLLQKAVRTWRRLKVINKRISYYCPYY
jgi:hypothetical protein